MKAIFNVFKRSPKLAALIAVVIGVVVVPASLLAWGPTRQTFTIEKPATYNTFNSITNNPNIGDERNFVGIRETGTNNNWTDDMTVQPGKSYTVRMYVHNNAASNLNLVAQNVTAKFNLPTTTAKSIQVNGFLNSSNASPQEVYDHATFNSASNFNVAYQAGTLKYENNFFGANGTPISESVFTSAGAKLGYNKLDGNIPGCFQYAGYLSFVVKAQVAGTQNFDFTKQVRKAGESEWKKSVAVNNGDSVEYQLSYKNTGDARQNNVALTDTLPAGINYTSDSTYLKNGTNPNPLKLTSNNLVTSTGINIGDYNPAAAGYVKFSAKVDDKSLICGTKTLTNTARAWVDGRYKEDSANVVLTKACQPGQTPPPVTPGTPVNHVTELPQTGIDTGLMTFIGLGATTAAAAYAVTSTRVRNLLRR